MFTALPNETNDRFMRAAKSNKCNVQIVKLDNAQMLLYLFQTRLVKIYNSLKTMFGTIITASVKAR